MEFIIDCIIAIFVIAGLISFLFWLLSLEENSSVVPSKKPNLPKDTNDTSNEVICRTSDLKIFRDELNLIDLSTISKERLLRKLQKMDSKISDQAPFDYNALIQELSFDNFKQIVQQLKDILNSTDLELRTTISNDELLSPINDAPSQTEYEDDKNFDDSAIMGMATVAGALFGEDNSKNRRIKQKHENLAKLRREHGFAKGYAPNWDPSEGLYSKYSDEEKYLDAKIEESKQKNLSYDMYLSEDEKRMFKDDISPGYWED